MRCPRCRGLLVISTLYDHERVYVGVRCVNCGMTTDAMQHHNRMNRPAKGWEQPVAGAKAPFRRKILPVSF